MIGEHADTGVLSGGGSSSVTPIGSLSTDGAAVMGVPMSKVYHPSSPLLAIRADAQAACVDFRDGSDREAALAAARDADLVIIIADEWRSEGLDAHGLELPDDQPQLIEAVASANPRPVVVLESGGPVDTSSAAHVPAVLAEFHPGSGGGPAIAGVLFGRLPVTFPQSVAQTPRPRQVDPTTTTSNPGEALVGEIFKVSYDIEGSDVGYRWFDRQKLEPAFPLGWGLSYTTFDVSDISVTASGTDVRVDITVTNTGQRAGAHVVQVYVSRNEGDGPADFVARLAAFARLHLEPGERRSVETHLEPRLLARWDDAQDAFRIAGGDYLVRIGAHALDRSGPAATAGVRPNTLR